MLSLDMKKKKGKKPPGERVGYPKHAGLKVQKRLSIDVKSSGKHEGNIKKQATVEIQRFRTAVHRFERKVKTGAARQRARKYMRDDLQMKQR